MWKVVSRVHSLVGGRSLLQWKAIRNTGDATYMMEAASF